MNKVVLMGRLTKDPELRYTTANNTGVCNFTLAIDRRFTRQGEDKQTDFIPIVTWNKLGEFCGKYFKKGRLVVIAGRIQTRTWDDNEGKRHYITEVVADEAEFAESKRPEDYQNTNVGSSMGNNSEEGFFPVEEDDELPF